jgi:cytochrome c1
MHEGYVFPLDKVGAHVIPRTPYPAGLTYDANLLAQGDVARGRALITNPANLGKAPCLTCHVINGEQAFVNDDVARGPNLTHLATRHTFAGGLFPLDPAHLAHWIKNAQEMKPGTPMNTFGIGQYSPLMKANVTVGLTDPEIADVVAYLLTLK